LAIVEIVGQAFEELLRPYAILEDFREDALQVLARCDRVPFVLSVVLLLQDRIADRLRLSSVLPNGRARMRPSSGTS
jgi:hypothetical protein